MCIHICICVHSCVFVCKYLCVSIWRCFNTLALLCSHLIFISMCTSWYFTVCLCCMCVMCVLDSPFSLSLFCQHSALSCCVVSHLVFLFLFVLLLFINAACTYSVEALRLQ